MNHVTHIRFMLCDKLENLPVLYVEWPVAQFLNIPPLHFINGQELLIMHFVVLEETILTD